jgi:hypothetical protein
LSFTSSAPSPVEPGSPPRFVATWPRQSDRAVLFANGTATDLGFAGRANAINSGGTVVGTSGSTAIRYLAGADRPGRSLSAHSFAP